MTDKKISELTSITGASVSDANDVLPIVDTSVATTKKITRAELFKSVSSVDINGGTIDGTVIGGSTPAAISGTTGTFSGNLTVDTDTLFVNAANNRVGIGTSSPQARLHVYNDQGGGSGRILIDANVTSGYNAKITATDVGLEFTTVTNSRGFSFNIGSTPTERMRIDASGNVGIGTTTPGSKLSIVGLPTSSAGLSAGDIWNDGGTLKIV